MVGHQDVCGDFAYVERKVLLEKSCFSHGFT